MTKDPYDLARLSFNAGFRGKHRHRSQTGCRQYHAGVTTLEDFLLLDPGEKHRDGADGQRATDA